MRLLDLVLALFLGEMRWISSTVMTNHFLERSLRLGLVNEVTPAYHHHNNQKHSGDADCGSYQVPPCVLRDARDVHPDHFRSGHLIRLVGGTNVDPFGTQKVKPQ